jgi:CubicO group peptidase (beta-lactamase class C family)
MRKLSLAFLFIAVTATASGQVAGVDKVERIVADAFARDSTGSITAGVVSNGELVWTKSYGLADMATKRAADRNTVYRIGSITKPFTALMLLQLVEAGKVHLSDPVEKYFPDIRRVEGLPAGAAPPTLLQLATMSAGLPPEPRREGDFWSGPVSRWEEILISALPHLKYFAAPGTTFQYSNIGYAILGASLGRAAGMPYVKWEREHVFAPLHMEHTDFELNDTIAPNLATGYEIARDGTIDADFAAREHRTGRGYKVPNGAIYTTVDDLARFVAFELGHGPESVLPAARLDATFKGFVASSPSLDIAYGPGFLLERRGADVFMGHSGSVAGYTSAMYYDRKAQLGVIVLRNAGGGKIYAPAVAMDALQALLANRSK